MNDPARGLSSLQITAGGRERFPRSALTARAGIAITALLGRRILSLSSRDEHYSNRFIGKIVVATFVACKSVFALLGNSMLCCYGHKTFNLNFRE